MVADHSKSDSRRFGLDDLIGRLKDPEFARLHRRQLSLRETSAHVNALMLATCAPDSLYVSAWHDHARQCPTCAKLFDYFGLPVLDRSSSSVESDSSNDDG